MQSPRRIKLTRRALLGAAGAALTQAAFATKDSFSGITLTASDVHPDHYPTVEAVRWMSDRIERETNGRMRIRVYHSGQLGREGDRQDHGGASRADHLAVLLRRVRRADARDVRSGDYAVATCGFEVNLADPRAMILRRRASSHRLAPELI